MRSRLGRPRGADLAGSGPAPGRQRESWPARSAPAAPSPPVPRRGRRGTNGAAVFAWALFSRPMEEPRPGAEGP